jgi:hypothetical protein
MDSAQRFLPERRVVRWGKGYGIEGRPALSSSFSHSSNAGNCRTASKPGGPQSRIRIVCEEGEWKIDDLFEEQPADQPASSSGKTAPKGGADKTPAPKAGG